MLKALTTTCGTTPPLSGSTQWHCNRCNTFVSIRSSEALEEAFCPVCGEAPLDFCGRFSSVSWVQYGDA